MPLKLNQEELPTINLTSMIDVLFLLIIFFMVGTRFTQDESNVQISLAQVAPGGAMMSVAAKPVYILADGSIKYENQKVSLDQLSAALAEAVRNYPGTTVQLNPDKDVKWQPLLDVHNAVTRSKAKIAGFSANSVRMPGTIR
jgi:biopolymer transport protein ExbD